MNQILRCGGFAATAWLLAGIWLGGMANAAPVRGLSLTVKQPDGTELKLKVWGDEFYRVYETEAGQTVVLDKATHEWRYARLSADGQNLLPAGALVTAAAPQAEDAVQHLRLPEAVRQQKVSALRAAHLAKLNARRREVRKGGKHTSGFEDFGGRVTTGTRKGVVILINFTDETSTTTRQQVDDFCNKVGYSDFSNYGSAHDYYAAVSNGRLGYTCDVQDYITVDHDRAYYAADYDKSTELVVEALTKLEARGFDFSTCDGDGDGVIDAVNLFYAGTRADDALWPHMSTVTFSADGVQTEYYQMSDLGTELSVYTFCHENGHMLCEFSDLYDYGYDSSGAGEYCLMAYPIDEKRPQYVCGYLRRRAGWVDAVEAAPGDYSLKAAASSTAGDTAALIYRHPTRTNEYFIIENRNQSGYDADLPCAGLAIWHVDENGSNDNQEQTWASHYIATLVQADGLWDLENYRNAGDSGDLFRSPTKTTFNDFTTPNARWWDALTSGLKVKSISAIGTTMSLTIEAGASLPVLTISATDPYADESGDTGTFKVSASFAPASDLTVKYALTGTATAGSDYETLSGTVTLAAGQTSVSFNVVPLEDEEDEDEETVVATLVLDAGPSYDLGSPGDATVTISDSTFHLPNDPFQRFVAYYFIYCLDREGKTAELECWGKSLAVGASGGSDVAIGFVFHPQCVARQLSNSAFVTMLYQAVFHRDGGAEEAAAWVAALQGGQSRLSVLQSFLATDEFAAICAAAGIAPVVDYRYAVPPGGIRDFVSRFYLYCLLRSADAAGLQGWYNDLHNGKKKGADVGTGFVLSQEFVNRNLADADFVDVLYRAFFNRDPDEAGKAGWLQALAGGTSREAVLHGFSHAQEFINLCQTYEIKPY